MLSSDFLGFKTDRRLETGVLQGFYKGSRFRVQAFGLREGLGLRALIPKP